MIKFIRGYCISAPAPGHYPSGAFRNYTAIEDFVVRARQFLTPAKALLFSAVAFGICLAVDPMNPFEAFLSPIKYGTMPERPAEIGFHVLIVLFFMPWLLGGLQESVIGILDTVTGKLSHVRYRLIVDNYGPEYLTSIV
ncbi:hypothetical protein R5M92_04265 [Halomonas sp. Bachu 37]|uniref:hypothetical protein n=1 Tax=Halomonas kashgarensis TaxID=3084920 RepID=UPI003216A374